MPEGIYQIKTIKDYCIAGLRYNVIADGMAYVENATMCLDNQNNLQVF